MHNSGGLNPSHFQRSCRLLSPQHVVTIPSGMATLLIDTRESGSPMALNASTLVLPQSGGNITLNKINQDGYTSEYLYRSATEEYRAKIRHSKVNRGTKLAPSWYDRHNVEVTQTVYAAGAVPEYYRKGYFVMEQLPGDTNVILMDAICDWGIATTNENLTDLLEWQS